MSSTIYDVAKKAGVGIGTVSRILNDSPQVSPKTREKVLLAIKELNYQPHALAQGLAKKQTHSIAVIVPVFTGYFFLEVLKGVQRKLSEAHYNLILYSIDQPEKTDQFLKKTLREKRVDGVLLISLQMSDLYAKKFIESSFPIVLVDSYHPEIDSITVNNEKGAVNAVQHLINIGHKRIGMIDGQLKSSPARIRLGGYKKALEQNSLPFDESLLVISDIISGQDGFNRESGYHAMQKLITCQKNFPSAVFCSSDIQAAGAIRAIKEHDLRIPDDIALVGFDDIEIAEYLDLTTMRQPMFEIGQLGTKYLMERIQGKSDNPVYKQFETKLVIRSSCGYKNNQF